MPKRKPQEDYAAELQKSHERWAHLYKYGGSDPFWEDGMNLNLVRNHIHYYRNKIEETMPPEGYPAAYHKEIPPEVEQKYMVRADEIRAAAKASLARYRADPNLQYIRSHRDDFTPKTIKKLCINAVIGYAAGLEQYIENDDLVAMRRHECAEHYLESFENCVRRMQETPTEEVQTSLFPFAADGPGELDDEGYGMDEDEGFGGMAMT